VRKKQVVGIIALILILDQAFKYYIKTNYYLGEDHAILGDWFHLHFVENEGMAWGWKFGESGSWGKIALTVFRLLAVGLGIYLLSDFMKKKMHRGFIFCVALILAGAIGNLIDSLFYGIIFEASDWVSRNVAGFLPDSGGYASLFHGKVVDMLYFPILASQFPDWMPWVGGEPFVFFSHVFNIADASISVGLIIILLFQKRFFKQAVPKGSQTVETNVNTGDDVQVN
jgi:signal peptidase II